MLIYNFNIDMSGSPQAPKRYIPFEDEMSPGPSRQNETSSENENNNGGPPNKNNNKPRTPDENEDPSDDSGSDKMKRIEETMRSMQNKLKKLSKKKKRKGKKVKEPKVVGETMEPPRKSARIDTDSQQTAFAPRLPSSEESQHRRSAPEQHRRSATNEQHLRSAHTERHLSSAELSDQNDDMISLLGEEEFHYQDDEDYEVENDQGDFPDLPAVETDNLEGDFEGLIDGLECVTSTEASGPEINSAWAQKLNNIWAEDNNMHSMKPIYEKYKVPSNCDTVCAPAMNQEMKRLLSNKWDKKTDITYGGMQKTLTKIFSATVQLNALNMAKTHTSESAKSGLQITTDIVTMLSQVNVELSNRRKFMLGKAIQPQFRQLCSKETVKPTKFLFGENVTQLIKDIQVKNKIAYKDDTRNTTRGRYNGKPFLGFGRGRPQGRAPRGRFSNQKGQQNQYHQYQNQYQNIPGGKKRH